MAEGELHHFASLIALVRILLVGLLIGARPVDEHQVYTEVQQLRGVEEDRLGQGPLALQQEVHRPVTTVLVYVRRSADEDSLPHQLGAGELGERLQRPVGDQAGHHSLDSGIPLPACQQSRQRLVLSPAGARDRPAPRLGPGAGTRRLPPRRWCWRQRPPQSQTPGGLAPARSGTKDAATIPGVSRRRGRHGAS